MSYWCFMYSGLIATTVTYIITCKLMTFKCPMVSHFCAFIVCESMQPTLRASIFRLFQQCTYCCTPDLPGNMLTLNDLGLLLEELLDVCARWFDLGLHLGVSVWKLERIDVQFSDARGLLQEVLKTWLTTAYNPSWKTLTNALRNVGACQLAKQLEAKYCRPKDMCESKH